MPKLPQVLRIKEIPEYVKTRYGLEITRATAYNWTTKGLRDEKLKTSDKRISGATHPTQRVTTAIWLDEFLRRSGVQLPVAATGDDRPVQGPGSAQDEDGPFVG